jgi:hypothetical protein
MCAIAVKNPPTILKTSHDGVRLVGQAGSRHDSRFDRDSMPRMAKMLARDLDLQ